MLFNSATDNRNYSFPLLDLNAIYSLNRYESKSKTMAVKRQFSWTTFKFKNVLGSRNFRRRCLDERSISHFPPRLRTRDYGLLFPAHPRLLLATPWTKTNDDIKLLPDRVSWKRDDSRGSPSSLDPLSSLRRWGLTSPLNRFSSMAFLAAITWPGNRQADDQVHEDGRKLTSFANGAAPQMISFTLLKSYFSTIGCFARNVSIGGTIGI